MSLPVIPILDTLVGIYMQGEYPELSNKDLDTASRIALANCKGNQEFMDMFISILTETLDEYVETRKEVLSKEPTSEEIEDLKKRAEALGFKLQPKYPKIQVFNCVCGAPHTKIYCTYDASLRGKVMRCHVCGRESSPRKYQYEAKQAWNDMIAQKLIETEKGDGD